MLERQDKQLEPQTIAIDRLAIKTPDLARRDVRELQADLAPMAFERYSLGVISGVLTRHGFALAGWRSATAYEWGTVDALRQDGYRVRIYELVYFNAHSNEVEVMGEIYLICYDEEY